VKCPDCNGGGCTRCGGTGGEDVTLRRVKALESIALDTTGIRAALEGLLFHVGLLSSGIEDLTAQLVMSERRSAARRKKKTKRKRRKPRGIAASLVSLVLLVGCGGLVEPDTRESVPVHGAEGGTARVEERDSGLDGHTIECTPDAEAHTGILCMHPKRRGDAR
jgi:hypothetical protein